MSKKYHPSHFSCLLNLSRNLKRVFAKPGGTYNHCFTDNHLVPFYWRIRKGLSLFGNMWVVHIIWLGYCYWAQLRLGVLSCALTNNWELSRRDIHLKENFTVHNHTITSCHMFMFYSGRLSMLIAAALTKDFICTTLYPVH